MYKTTTYMIDGPTGCCVVLRESVSGIERSRDILRDRCRQSDRGTRGLRALLLFLCGKLLRQLSCVCMEISSGCNDSVCPSWGRIRCKPQYVQDGDEMKSAALDYALPTGESAKTRDISFLQGWCAG